MNTNANRPLFASISLAARIETAECRLLTDGAETIAQRTKSEDIFVEPLAGGVAVFTNVGSPLNKVAGLGFDGPVDEGELETVEQAYGARGATVHVEVATLADPSICATLTRRGYTLVSFENVLGRSLPVDWPAMHHDDIEISTITEDEVTTWIDTLVTGFATPDTQGVPSHESFAREILEPIMRDLAATRGFHLYLARLRGVVAGGASMRSVDGVTLLCGAATLPEHRRCGVHAALLRQRLLDASQAGNDVVIVTTQPGSKSQENVQRNGFELLYTRAILETTGGRG